MESKEQDSGNSYVFQDVGAHVYPVGKANFIKYLLVLGATHLIHIISLK